jgi:hypothetical protein
MESPGSSSPKPDTKMAGSASLAAAPERTDDTSLRQPIGWEPFVKTEDTSLRRSIEGGTFVNSFVVDFHSLIGGPEGADPAPVPAVSLEAPGEDIWWDKVPAPPPPKKKLNPTPLIHFKEFKQPSKTKKPTASASAEMASPDTENEDVNVEQRRSFISEQSEKDRQALLQPPSINMASPGTPPSPPPPGRQSSPAFLQSRGGLRIVDLCEEDKGKVAKLISQLVKVGKENEEFAAKLEEQRKVNAQRLQRLRLQNDDIIQAEATIRGKFNQSLLLLNQYQSQIVRMKKKHQEELEAGRCFVLAIPITTSVSKIQTSSLHPPTCHCYHCIYINYGIRSYSTLTVSDHVVLNMFLLHLCIS